MPILKTESYKKGIAYSTLLNVVSKGLVFINSLVVAFYFGTQIKTDIYFYTYNTIVILSAFITSLNASVLIPESMRIRIKEGEEKSKGFLNLFIYGYIALTSIIVIVFVADPVHIFKAMSSFELQSIQDQKSILLLAVPLIVMMPLVNLLTDVMASYKYFTAPMIAGIINGVFSIVFVVVFHSVLDIISLLFGLLASYSINLLLLIFLMAKKLSWNFRFARTRIERRIWRNIGFAQAGNITSSLSTYAPLYLLSGFSAGIVTSLNFAQQISSLPTHLLTNQFSSITGIKFNEQYARGEYFELNKTFVTTSGFLLFVLFPVSGIMFLFPGEIVSLLLERGEFGEKGVIETALFLKYLGFLSPLLVINVLFSRLFMAAQKISESFVYQVSINIFQIFLMYVLIKHFGESGYPLAILMVSILNVFFLYFLGKYYFNFINYKNIFEILFKNLILNFGIILTLHFLMKWTLSFSGIITLFLGGCFYIVLIIVIGTIFSLNTHFNFFLQQVFKKYTIFKRNNYR